MLQIREEESFTKGRITVRGKARPARPSRVEHPTAAWIAYGIYGFDLGLPSRSSRYAKGL